MFKGRLDMGGDAANKLARCEAHAGTGMLQDVAELATMKFRIGGHRREPRMPDAEHQLDIVGTILRDYGNAVAGLQQKTVAQ